MNIVKLVLLANNRIGWLVSNGKDKATYDYNGWYSGIYPLADKLTLAHRRAIKADQFSLNQIKYSLERIAIPLEGINYHWKP